MDVNEIREKELRTIFEEDAKEDLIANLHTHVYWEDRFLVFLYNDFEFAFDPNYDGEQFYVIVENREWGFEDFYDAVDWIKDYKGYDYIRWGIEPKKEEDGYICY